MTTLEFRIAGPVVPNSGDDPPGIALPAKLGHGELYWLYIVFSELHLQTTYSLITFKRVCAEADDATGAVFPSIHSMLTASANVSKLLRPELTPGSHLDKKGSATLKRRVELLREAFGPLATAKALTEAVDRRNDLDHLDDRLDERVHRALSARMVTLGLDLVISNHNFVTDGKEPAPVRLFNKVNRVFNVLGNEIDLLALARELDRIRLATESLLRTTKREMAANASRKRATDRESKK